MNPTEIPTSSIPPSDANPPPRTSRLAIASLVLGILGLLVLPAVAGFVCGIVALIQISRSSGRLKGHGIALAGTIVSGVMLALVPIVAILAALLLPALASAKGKAQSIMGMNNVKQLCLGAHLYASDQQDTFPARTNWCEALQPYLGGNTTVFLRPQDQGKGKRCSYAYNANVAGAKITEVDPSTVLFFETEAGGWNMSGGPELARRPAFGEDPIVVGFADGHSETIGPGPRLDALRWER